MQHSHGITVKCMCGAPKEDQEHIFHQCPNLEEIRKPYRETMQAVVQESAYTRQALEDLIPNDAFRNCGLVPESEDLNKIQDDKEEEEDDPEIAPASHTLTDAERAGELHEDGWIRIITDGSTSATHPTFDWRWEAVPSTSDTGALINQQRGSSVEGSTATELYSKP